MKKLILILTLVASPVAASDSDWEVLGRDIAYCHRAVGAVLDSFHLASPKYKSQIDLIGEYLKRMRERDKERPIGAEPITLVPETSPVARNREEADDYFSAMKGVCEML